MAERFNQKVNLQVQNTGTGAASGLMNLSNKFRTLAGQERQKREAKAIEESTLAGQQAFNKGNKPKFMDEDRLIGGVTAKAYNNGLRAAYTASISNDVRKDLAKAELDHPNDMNAYNNAVAAQRAALESTVDPVALPEVLAVFDKYSTNGSIRVQSSEEVKTRKQTTDAINESISSAGEEAERFARLGEIASAQTSISLAKSHLDGAVQAGMLTQDKADEALSFIKNKAIESENRFKFEQLAETKGFDAAYEELDKIAGRPPKGWTVDEWGGYIKSQQAELSAKQRRQAQEVKITKAELEKQQDFADIEQRLAGDERVVLNQKSTDAYYDEVISPAIANAPPEVRDAATAEFIDKTKVVPSSVKSKNTSYIRSGNPDLISESASFMNRLDNIPGVSESLASPNERAYAETVVDLMANMEPAEAVKAAMKATDPKDQARIQAVDQQLKDQFSGIGASNEADWYKEQAEDTYSKFWGSDPTIDPINADEMGKEWGDAYKAYRRGGMDKEQATKAAQGVIKRNWSEFNGQIVKYSPEVYYAAPDGDNEYMFDQLLNDINADSLTPVGLESIKIISDSRTSRTASSGAPDYRVAVIQPSGEIFRYPDTFRWSPDLGAELKRREAENAKAAAERRARAINKADEKEASKALERMRGF